MNENKIIVTIKLINVPRKKYPKKGPKLKPLYLFSGEVAFAIATPIEIKNPIKNIGITDGKFPKFEANTIFGNSNIGK